MNKLNILLVLLFSSLMAKSQIVIDNNPPYDNPTWLVDNILLGGGVIATNHTFQGEPSQIGWFDAINTNLGIDNGIVMCTGDIYALDPINGGSFPPMPNTVTDPDLLAVANSVPGMIGQSFSVSSINDVAILEFDFVPTSDSMEFRYAFGSQEYFTYENTQYNDVFGFFLSGPGIAGPWANGAINLAVVPNTNPPLPITISSVNSVTPINQQYFVPNQGTGLDTIADADGHTTVFTAQALVQCGATYHIKLAIADGSDQGLSSYVWLEAGSFYSPPLSIADDLGIDSAIMNIPCNSTVTLTANGGVGATYQWFDSTSVVFSTNSSITVGAGLYVVSADIAGCAVISDTLIVVEGDYPTFDLGADFMIPCNADTLIDPIVSGGTAPYSYLWNSGDIDSMMVFSEGVHSVVVTDFYGCSGADTLEITYDVPPSIDLGADFMIPCNADTLIDPIVSGGTAPYSYLWNSGNTDSMLVFSEGIYNVVVTDFFGCSGADTLEVIYAAAPVIDLGVDYTIPCNTTTILTPNIIGGAPPFSYVWNDGSINSSIAIAEGNYAVTVAGLYGCSDSDAIEITEDTPGTVTVSGGGSICDDGTTIGVSFTFNGLLPWDLEFTNGLSSQAIQSIPSANYLFTTSNSGVYDVVVADDVNDCLANTIGTAQVIVYPLPVANISPAESFIYEGDTIVLGVGNYSMYQWYDSEGLELDTLSELTVSDSGIFYVWVRDLNGCEDESEFAIVHTQPQTNLFIPNTFTPNSDDHNELFVIQGINIKTFNIRIFNRWGELLFMSKSIEKSWDGTFANKKVQEGPYYYQIEVLGGDGGIFKKAGTVTVIY